MVWTVLSRLEIPPAPMVRFSVPVILNWPAVLSNVMLRMLWAMLTLGVSLLTPPKCLLALLSLGAATFPFQLADWVQSDDEVCPTSQVNVAADARLAAMAAQIPPASTRNRPFF